MGWTNLAILSTGLGIGAIGGWIVARLQLQSSQSVSPNSVANPPTIPINIPAEGSISGVSPSDASATHSSDLSNRSNLQVSQEQFRRTQLAYQMAKEMEQFKAGFLARTSHELRSPINSVISLHQLILADLCENAEEEREFVAQANEAAQKMLAILDQLIKVSKATHGTEQLRFQAVSIEDVLMEVQQFASLQARNRNLRLVIEYPETDWQIHVDRDWLRQVLVHLIDVPISLMEEGTVRLTTQVDEAAQQLKILIEDERPAIFWQDSIDLFHPFHPDQSSSPPEKQEIAKTWQDLPSPGLSLLVDQTLLELMGGRLELISPAAPLTEAEETPEASSQALTCIQCTVPLAID